MATQLYTFLITYDGLEDKIWRKVQVSSNYRLDQLGYLVLASFDTLAYHLFEFEYKGQRYELPSDEFDLDAILDVAYFKLSKLKMSIGDKLKMIYDFGTEQVFSLKLLSIEPMPQGKGNHYPWIVDGAGCGILDDVDVEDLKEFIEQIDRNGCTDEPVYYNESEVPWDYRQFNLTISNMVLKALIKRIQESYSPFWDIYEEE